MCRADKWFAVGLVLLLVSAALFLAWEPGTMPYPAGPVSAVAGIGGYLCVIRALWLAVWRGGSC